MQLSVPLSIQAAIQKRHQLNLFIVSFILLLAACSDDSDTASQQVEQGQQAVVTQQDASTVKVAENCEPGEGIAYLCGVINGEDILQIGSSDWLLVSGMDGSLSGSDIRGKIHLVNAVDKSAEILFPGNAPVYQHNTELYGQCPGPLDAQNFSAHGLSLQKTDKGPETYRVYMTSHGAREAIEVFEVEAFIKPTITWVGCIPMPTSSWTNSVAILEDGGFLATQFFNPALHGIGDVLAGDITGHVFEWHPGEEVRIIPGTELAGANGIAITEDERLVFVAAFGTGELVRFDRSSTPVGRQTIALGIAPDNIRWTGAGTLLAAGNNTADYCGEASCEAGWSVIEITPDSLETIRIGGAGLNSAMHDASSALLVNGEIWVGTYGGDRLAILPR